jgi:hypothetical protein
MAGEGETPGRRVAAGRRTYGTADTVAYGSSRMSGRLPSSPVGSTVNRMRSPSRRTMTLAPHVSHCPVIGCVLLIKSYN